MNRIAVDKHVTDGTAKFYLDMDISQQMEAVFVPYFEVRMLTHKTDTKDDLTCYRFEISEAEAEAVKRAMVTTAFDLKSQTN